MNKRKKKWCLFSMLAFLIIQLIGINKRVPKTHPKDDYFAIVNAPEEIQTMISTSCYNCHSYQTQYPWYAEVAPLSWWIKGHIDHGREKLNFSIWNGYSTKKQIHIMEECTEILEKHAMPLKSYLWLHPEARLSETQRKELIDWFKK